MFDVFLNILNHKIVTIIIILLIVVVGLYVYNYFFGSKEVPENTSLKEELNNLSNDSSDSESESSEEDEKESVIHEETQQVIDDSDPIHLTDQNIEATIAAG